MIPALGAGGPWFNSELAPLNAFALTGVCFNYILANTPIDFNLNLQYHFFASDLCGIVCLIGRFPRPNLQQTQTNT
jgi:hypothetical protein